MEHLQSPNALGPLDPLGLGLQVKQVREEVASLVSFRILGLPCSVA